jgi:serine/threonine protein phosphatase PrpC
VSAIGVSVAACPACGAWVGAEDRFCEACGQRLQARWLSSRAVEGTCESCGSMDFGPEGYCDHCGQRRAVGQNRVELDLGPVAAVTDRGRQRHQNEDAIAIARLGTTTTVTVVCDGVSSCVRADAASHAAADAGMAAVLDALEGGAWPRSAIELAGREAAAAVARLAGPNASENPPSCTYVSAVLTDTDITVGWVGDSRAYWLAADPAGSTCLTVDDSLAGRLTEELADRSGEAGEAGTPANAGPPGAAGALADAGPHALSLLRWLGADATDTEPRVVVFTPTAPGRLLVCSDGLHRYLPRPADLAAAASSATHGSAAAAIVARALTQLALDAGGQDNIAVAVLEFPPADHTDLPGGATP